MAQGAAQGSNVGDKAHIEALPATSTMAVHGGLSRKPIEEATQIMASSYT
jgi:hypothetical protein